jgi:hypothetical protein
VGRRLSDHSWQKQRNLDPKIWEIFWTLRNRLDIKTLPKWLADCLRVILDIEMHPLAVKKTGRVVNCAAHQGPFGGFSGCKIIASSPSARTFSMAVCASPFVSNGPTRTRVRLPLEVLNSCLTAGSLALVNFT